MTPELARALRRYAFAAQRLAALAPAVLPGEEWVAGIAARAAENAASVSRSILYPGRKPQFDDVTFRALIDEGVPPKDIAGRLGVSVSRVYQKRREIGLPHRKLPRLTPEKLAAFKAAWIGNESLEDIAARFGVTISRVCQIQRMLKLPRRPRARSPVPLPAGAPVPRRAESGGGAGRSIGAPGPAGNSTKANGVRVGAEPEKPKALPSPLTVGFWQAPVAASIARLPDGTRATPDELIRFLRTRDYSIVGAGTGQWRIDGRRVVDAAGLLELANRARERLGKAPLELTGAACG